MRLFFLCFLTATAAPNGFTHRRQRVRKKISKNAIPVKPREAFAPRIRDVPIVSAEESFEITFASPSQPPLMRVVPTVTSSSTIPTMGECKDDPSYISPVNPKFGKSH